MAKRKARQRSQNPRIGSSFESWLDEEGLREEATMACIKHAIASLDGGKAIEHKEVKDWVNSWGRTRERPAPKHATR